MDFMRHIWKADNLKRYIKRLIMWFEVKYATGVFKIVEYNLYSVFSFINLDI